MPSRQTKKIVYVVFVLFVAATALLFFTARNAKDRFDPKNPVILTIWHNPTGQDQDALSAAADRFNLSVGKNIGISILATTIAKSELIHEKLTSIALESPGAPEAPDIVIAYPKSVNGLINKGLLVPFDDYFTSSELDAYVPSFIEDGRLVDGKLYVFPIGRSTEGLIINRTFWDRFSAETGTPVSELSTFAGLARTAEKYYEWTDAKTPETADDGSAFFIVDNPFNLVRAAFAQAGEELFVDGELNVESQIYENAWRFLFEPAVKGHEAVYKGYGTDIAKTGKLVCWTSSTAAVTFMPKNVTYEDNTSEPVEFEILPFPVIEGGKKVALQRGGGFCLFKSTPIRQKAAVVFLKWLTEPAENLRYLDGVGYMPVTKAAVETASESWRKDASGIWKSYAEMMKIMNDEYVFLTQASVEKYAELEILYEQRLRKISASAREKYLENLRFGREMAWERATETAYE